jgi:hypothetical protein
VEIRISRVSKLMNVPPNEDNNWTVCSESDELEPVLPEADLDEVDEHEWTVCTEDSDHDCTEALDYVNQLIARMNGDESPPAKQPPSPPPSVIKTEPRPTETRPTTAQKPSSSVTRPKAPERPSKPVVKSETAEERQMRIAHRPLVMAADMQRLREAVNLSMSSTLKSLDQRYVLRQAYAYLVICGGFIGSSMILLSMSPRLSSASYAASALAAGVAALAAWKFAKVVRRLADIVRSDQRLT